MCAVSLSSQLDMNGIRGWMEGHIENIYSYIWCTNGKLGYQEFTLQVITVYIEMVWKYQ